VTARDTAALALQVEALTAEVGRLASAVEAMRLATSAVEACWQDGYEHGRQDRLPAAGSARPHRGSAQGDRRGLRLAGDGTPGGAR
jgi:hypothetical protein